MSYDNEACQNWYRSFTFASVFSDFLFSLFVFSFLKALLKVRGLKMSFVCLCLFYDARSFHSLQVIKFLADLIWVVKLMFCSVTEIINPENQNEFGGKWTLSYFITILTLSIGTDRPEPTVQILIRCHRKWHLIRIYTVCKSSKSFLIHQQVVNGQSNFITRQLV